MDSQKYLHTFSTVCLCTIIHKDCWLLFVFTQIIIIILFKVFFFPHECSLCFYFLLYISVLFIQVEKIRKAIKMHRELKSCLGIEELKVSMSLRYTLLSVLILVRTREQKHDCCVCCVGWLRGGISRPGEESDHCVNCSQRQKTHHFGWNIQHWVSKEWEGSVWHMTIHHTEVYQTKLFHFLLSLLQRFNVAVTRAKSLLIMVGNPIILRTDATWGRYINFQLTHA